jgi:hypothetical protein
LAEFLDSWESCFIAGVVLHTGPRLFQMGGRITAAPICTLWG